jgi:hypothetical protein
VNVCIECRESECWALVNTAAKEFYKRRRVSWTNEWLISSQVYLDEFMHRYVIHNDDPHNLKLEPMLLLSDKSWNVHHFVTAKITNNHIFATPEVIQCWLIAADVLEKRATLFFSV